MSREPHIPLFLWVATAIVAHAIWGGGAHEAAKAIEETLDIGQFAREVQRHVRMHSVPVEISLLDEQEAPTLEVPPTPPTEPVTDPNEVPPEDTPPEEPVEPKKKPEEKKPEEKKAEPEKRPEEKKEQEKPADPQKADPPEIVQLKVPNRIAVEQHVEDENQEDNPDAAHIAEHANRVEKETRARITATDQNAREPSPGGHHVGSDPEPGNSEESRVAQSEDAPGEQDHPPGAPAPADPRPATAPEPPRTAASPPAGGGSSAPRAPAPSPPRAAQAEQLESPHVHEHTSGRWSLARPLEPQPAQKALPQRQAQRPTDFLGLGAPGTTKNGVNLNLTPQMAVAAVGADQLARERRLDGERRRSAHRGSWKSLGLEHWKPALENYVATVQPGNQTALNTARVPFARYLNAIHARIHPVFADSFLDSLTRLPKDHPLNREEMSTHLEIVLSKEDGRIVRMGITKSSGVTAFDVGALDSVQKASPFGTPPEVIVSPDGNVYLHWEFHRIPHYACSTYFARPYILKGAPGTAPPNVAPPRSTPPAEQFYDPSGAPSARPGVRSGFLHRDQHAPTQPRG
jgi:TonB family protein